MTQVLVVDDDVALRMLMAQSPGSAGMLVDEAADGEQALAAFGRQRPDLVLLDVVMPGMDGFEVCRALRKLPHGENVPVLVVTGLDDTNSLEEADQIYLSPRWKAILGQQEEAVGTSPEE